MQNTRLLRHYRWKHRLMASKTHTNPPTRTHFSLHRWRSYNFTALREKHIDCFPVPIHIRTPRGSQPYAAVACKYALVIERVFSSNLQPAVFCEFSTASIPSSIPLTHGLNFSATCMHLALSLLSYAYIYLRQAEDELKNMPATRVESVTNFPPSVIYQLPRHPSR